MENACKGLCDICDSSDCITRAGTETKINKSNYSENMTELEFKGKKLRVYDLKMYNKTDYLEQLLKIEEEFNEIVNHTDKENLAEEIGDLIQAAIGLSIVAEIELKTIQNILDKKRIERGDIK